jgi:hypothetical protein
VGLARLQFDELTKESGTLEQRLLRLIRVEDAVPVGTFKRVDRAQPAAAIVVDPTISAMGDLPAKEDRVRTARYASVTAMTE